MRYVLEGNYTTIGWYPLGYFDTQTLAADALAVHKKRLHSGAKLVATDYRISLV